MRVFVFLALLLPIFSFGDSITDEFVLHKYSGKIDKDEVSFVIHQQTRAWFPAIYAASIILPNEPEIALDADDRIAFDKMSVNIPQDIEISTSARQLAEKIEEIAIAPDFKQLKVSYDDGRGSKVMTLDSQEPEYIRSYIETHSDDSSLESNYCYAFVYFPDLQIGITSDGVGFEAKTYKEAKKLTKYDERKTTKCGESGSWMGVSSINNVYVAFNFSKSWDSGGMFGVGEIHSGYAGLLLDIKSKKFIPFDRIFKEPNIPLSLACKYRESRHCSECGKSRACNEKITIANTISLDRGRHFSGKYSVGKDQKESKYILRFSLDGNEANAGWQFQEKVGDIGFIDNLPLKELKPYIKPEWYSYLIGKGELPKLP